MSEQGTLFKLEAARHGLVPHASGDTKPMDFRAQVEALIAFYRDRRPKAGKTDRSISGTDHC